jgi:cation diffusion facilitator CzcD-associated flavoprotein CzcO
MSERRVAVVGAGAAGLVAARELLRCGHEVTVFEQSGEIGGVWVYTPDAEDDPLGRAGTRVHSSLYPSLRTNLPRDLMAFIDYPFDARGGGEDHWPRFPGHTEVLTYLRRFADRFDLRASIRFGTRVTSIRRDDGWTVTSEHHGTAHAESFDAVAVCNGHYAEPRLPALDGLDRFPGAVLHSHNYRVPDAFRGRSVAVLGASASGVDLAREIGALARHVYWCAESFALLPSARRGAGTIEHRAAIANVQPDGALSLQDGTAVPPVDALVLCTGYRYDFPFLADNLIRVEDNWVQPLWQDLLHARHTTLAFIGIPFKVVPFPLFEVQARWFARLLDGHVRLPNEAERLADTERHIAHLRATGVRQRHFHQRSLDCYDYLDALSDQCAHTRIPDWHRQLTAALLAHVAAHPGDYRERRLATFTES